MNLKRYASSIPINTDAAACRVSSACARSCKASSIPVHTDAAACRVPSARARNLQGVIHSRTHGRCSLSRFERVRKKAARRFPFLCTWTLQPVASQVREQYSCKASSIPVHMDAAACRVLSACARKPQGIIHSCTHGRCSRLRLKCASNTAAYVPDSAQLHPTARPQLSQP